MDIPFFVSAFLNFRQNSLDAAEYLRLFRTISLWFARMVGISFQRIYLRLILPLYFFRCIFLSSMEMVCHVDK